MLNSKFWGTLQTAATEFGENLGNSASEFTKTVSEATSQAFEEVQKSKTDSNSNAPLDLATVPESDRLAFYGALFAIAMADGSIDKDEIDFIFGVMDLEGMSESAKRQVFASIVEPPPLYDCLNALSTADERLRFALMVNLIDVAWSNDELDANERKAIELAQQKLHINDEQVRAIETFVHQMREIRVRGLDDDRAADAVKSATAGLSAVGVPIAAVYFSGSVIGLSAAGITSGLAALGLGFGMVPGIGIAVLVGAGIFMGASRFLDVGSKSKKAQLQAERERKAQLVIANLQSSISELMSRINDLQKAAADAQSNKEAIRILTERLKKLQQIVRRRQNATGEA